MAEPQPPSQKLSLDSFTVKHINKTIQPGDCVLMRPSDPSKPLSVASVEGIESDTLGSHVDVHVRWYYRPEESIVGRRKFHGSRELFLSDHYATQSADTIQGKCFVHNFKNCAKFDPVGDDDFFYRFEYNRSTGVCTPDRVVVHCNCEMPYNPDLMMVQCESERCRYWFHPACIGMTEEEAKSRKHFICELCSPQGQ